MGVPLSNEGIPQSHKAGSRRPHRSQRSCGYITGIVVTPVFHHPKDPASINLPFKHFVNPSLAGFIPLSIHPLHDFVARHGTAHQPQPGPWNSQEIAECLEQCLIGFALNRLCLYENLEAVFSLPENVVLLRVGMEFDLEVHDLISKVEGE